MVIVTEATCAEKLMNQLDKIAKRNGFGLWKVNTKKKNPKEVRKPKHFRELMKEQFESPSDPKVKALFSDDERLMALPTWILRHNYVYMVSR